MRTTPETDGRRLYELVRAHVERAGYHLIDGQPTEAERAQFDRLARFTRGSTSNAMRMPVDSAVGRWATAALRAPTAPQPDERPIQIRMMGGTVPTEVLIEALRLPFVLVPTVNDDNNQHAANENLRIPPLLDLDRDDLQPPDHAVPALKLPAEGFRTTVPCR